MDPTALPRLGPDAAFVPMDRLGGRPHICVDGRTGAGAVLELSHWPGCATPTVFADLTATAIVGRYLDAGPGGPEVDAVSNNHVDIDGLLSAWLLLEGPGTPPARRALATAAAEVGDFGTWTDPDALRVALTLTAMAERPTTPLAAVRDALAPAAPRDPTGPLHLALLPRVTRVLDDPARWEHLWRPGWDAVQAQVALFETGEAVIDEFASADLAVLRTPGALARVAWAPRTDRARLLTVLPDRTMVLEQRYESWVAFAVRPVAPRVDLTGAAERLNRLEPGGGWRFEGLAQSTPRLLRAGPAGRPAPSSLHPDALLEVVMPDLEATPARVAP